MYEERYQSAMQERQNDIMPFSQMDDWSLAEGVQDIRGWDVVDNTGDKIGKVDDFLASPSTQQIVFAVISYGGVMGMGATRAVVPFDALDFDMENRQVIYPGSADDIRSAPEFSDDTSDFNQFYDYWSGKAGMRRAPMPEREAPPVVEEEREPVAGRKGGERATEEECKGMDLREKQRIEDLTCGRIKRKEER